MSPRVLGAFGRKWAVEDTPEQKTVLASLRTSFSPLDIANIALWLDVSNAASIFQDSSGTTPSTATTDPIGLWRDISGNGCDWSETGLNRPTLQLSGTNALNGLPTVYGDGVQSGLSGNTAAKDLFRNRSGMTVFLVHWRTGGVNSYPLHASLDSASYGSRGVICFDSLNRWNVGGRRVTGDTETYATSVAYADSNPHILCGTWDYNAAVSPVVCTVYRDGAQVQQRTAMLSAGSTSNNASTVANLFRHQANGTPTFDSWMQGGISELVAFARVLTSTEIAQVQAYLKAKWGTA